MTAPAQALQQARQGHLYQHGKSRVLAMESGPLVRCREVRGDDPPWMGPVLLLKAHWLEPLPMRYFHDELPHG